LRTIFEAKSHFNKLKSEYKISYECSAASTAEHLSRRDESYCLHVVSKSPRRFG